jgi:predicted Zn-dependent protease
MNTSESALARMIQGNTLEAQEILRAAPARDSDPLARLNRFLYGADPAAGQALESEKESLLARLPQSQDPEQAVLEYNAGCIALFQEDILEAKHRFEDVVARQPGNRLARHNLAYANELLAELDEAKAQYELVLAQDPQFHLSRLNLALLLLQEGDSEGAVAELRALAEEQPDNPGLALYLCRALLAQPTSESAKDALAVLDACPTWQQFAELRECHAFALFTAGRQDGAKGEFDELVQANPESLFARLGQIKILAAQGALQALAKLLKDYEALNPQQSVRGILDLVEGR